jgi:hypothetical protein
MFMLGPATGRWGRVETAIWELPGDVHVVEATKYSSEGDEDEVKWEMYRGDKKVGEWTDHMPRYRSAMAGLTMPGQEQKEVHHGVKGEDPKKYLNENWGNVKLTGIESRNLSIRE